MKKLLRFVVFVPITIMLTGAYLLIAVLDRLTAEDKA